jgi:hypothetical protein
MIRSGSHVLTPVEASTASNFPNSGHFGSFSHQEFLDEATRCDASAQLFFDNSCTQPIASDVDQCTQTDVSAQALANTDLIAKKKRAPLPRLGCIGDRFRKCADKFKKTWSYRGPWEAHFTNEHLHSYYDIPTYQYVCFCLKRRFEHASDFKEHVWAHMRKSSGAGPTANEQ